MFSSVFVMLRIRQKWAFIIFLMFPNFLTAHTFDSMTAVLAKISVSYNEPATGVARSVTAEIGRFANSNIGSTAGVLFTGVREKDPSRTHAGCSPNLDVPPPKEPWIALFNRGSCPDERKVKNAKALNASAVLLYGIDQETYLQQEHTFQEGPVVIYLLHRKGELFWHLVQSGTHVYISITRGQEVKFRITSINRTSVLFVSVSFIVLMIVSLAWLIFYYVQRFRYVNAKDRLARHLNNAAKKALAKIPDRHLKADDWEIVEKESCAVCIEPYIQGDTVRILPCKHNFHKTCVDPWLLEHRTCPMCKMDILKHYGYITNNSEENSRSDASAEAGAVNPPRRSSFSNLGRESNHTQLPQVSIISETRNDVCSMVETTSSNGQETVPPVSADSGLESLTSSVIRSMIEARINATPSAPPTSSIEIATPSAPPTSSNAVEESLHRENVNRSPALIILDETAVSHSDKKEIESLVQEIIDRESDDTGGENCEFRSLEMEDSQKSEAKTPLTQSLLSLNTDEFPYSSPNPMPAVDEDRPATALPRRLSLATVNEEREYERRPSTQLRSVSHS